VTDVETVGVPVLSLGLLGPPRIEHDGKPVHFDTRKAIALLALVSMADQPLSRERLAMMLWPDSDGDRARGALRRTVSVTAAGVGAALVVNRTTIGLDADRVQVDAAEFRRLLGAGDVDSLERACELYRGDFLTGFAVRDSPDFDDWQSSTAEDLRQRLSTALDELVAARLGTGDLDRALEFAHRWVGLDVLHEPAQQATIRLLAMTGQRAAALRQYRACVRVLADELGVAPLRETTSLYDDVRAGRVAASTRPAARVDSLVAAVQQPPTADDFVGRAAELSLLEAALLVVPPRRRLVALTGEMGSGKTRLVAKLAARTTSSSVLMVRAHRGETNLPFAVLTDLLAQILSRQPEITSVVPAHVALEAARLVPGFSPTAVPPEALASSIGLTRMYGAIATILVAAADAASGEPGLVVLDDAHWADDATLGVLGYIVNRLPELPVRLVLTWAPESAGRLAALRTAVSEAVEAGLALVVPVEPFGPAEIDALLAASPSVQLDPVRLLAETRGLPLLVVEYLRAAQTGTVETPPASVRELLVRRLDAAHETTIQVVSAAAVLDGRFDADLLRAVGGRSDAETADALDDAMRHRLLEESPSTLDGAVPAYDFPFEALRRVVSERTTFARRRLLHGRAADALARQYDRLSLADSSATPASATVTPAVVAHHFEQAGRDAEAAPWWWRAAARSRALYAHEQAYSDLSRALALGYSAFDVWSSTGDVLVALGRYTEALGAYETAVGLADDAELVAGVEHKLAEVHHRLGDWGVADDHLRAAVELLDGSAAPAPAPAALMARIGSDRALIAYRRGDVVAARELADHALQTATAAADAMAAAQALDVLGMLSAAGGDLGAAEDLLRRSIESALTLPDSGVAVAGLNNLARVLADRGRRAEALDAAREALRLGAERGDQHRLAALHTNLADLLHAAGDENAALDHLKEAARLFASVDTGGEPRAEVWTLVEW
jgi:DNA-binding SARP family transcriptional activator/tetratricopeptide (TPR) repeat protein